MKKILTTLALAIVSAAAVNAQGYFNFVATGSPVWQTFVNGTAAKSSGNVDIAFLIGTGTSQISALGASSSLANNSTVSSAAWADLLGDSSYTLATNSSTSATIQYTTSTGLGAGNINGTQLGVNGTTTTGVYNIIVFGWNSAYSTAAAAAAAGAAVGWYTINNYAAVAQNGTGATLTAAGLNTFGVDPIASVPEPTTIALAGLGGLALLGLRRKK